MSRQMFNLRARAALIAAALLVGSLVPANVRASTNDEEVEAYDARILNYPQNVQLDSGSTATSWIVLALLGALTIGVMFKNANRSHLD